ncbi:hypothetical protein QCD75_01350 [Arthrobacter sp. PsM3]|nr:hypothetical protein [Arthrobacter sp. PsM3]
MANHKISPGSWDGMSEPAKLAKNLYRTTGRYRTLDGLRRPQRFATGSTPRKAKIALQAVFERLAADDRAKKKAADENAKTRRQQGVRRSLSRPAWTRTRAAEQGPELKAGEGTASLVTSEVFLDGGLTRHGIAQARSRTWPPRPERPVLLL